MLRFLRTLLSWRVSNAVVFGRAGVRSLSEQLLKQQLLLLGKVAHSPDDGPLRRDTFVPGSLQPQIGRFVRRVGRPRQNWTSELLRIGSLRVGAKRFENMMSDRTPGAQDRWKAELARLFPAVVSSG